MTVDLRNLAIHVRRTAGQVSTEDLEKLFYTLADKQVVTLSGTQFVDSEGDVVDVDHTHVLSVAWSKPGIETEDSVDIKEAVTEELDREESSSSGSESDA